MGERQPTAFLSKLLDSVTRRWPQMHPVSSKTSPVSQSKQIVDVWHSLMVNVHHQVSVILSQRAEKWLAGSRVCRYNIILVEKKMTSFTPHSSLSPAEFSVGSEALGA